MATLTFQNNTRLTYIDGTTDVGYDNAQRIVNVRWETTGAPLGEGTVVVGFNYKYDSNNNVLVAEKLHDPGNSEVYTYQSDGQLASFARGTLDSDTKTYIATPTTTTGILQSQNWTLDGQGNWDQTQTTIGNTTNTETRTQSANNEIDTQTVNSGTPTGLTYDKNGNLTNDGVRKYVWDPFNRLVTVKTESGTVVACYFYDASGRRMRAVVSAGGINGDAVNGTTDFYHDGPRVIEEHDGSDAITQQYVYGNGEDEVLDAGQPARRGHGGGLKRQHGQQSALLPFRSAFLSLRADKPRRNADRRVYVRSLRQADGDRQSRAGWPGGFQRQRHVDCGRGEHGPQHEHVHGSAVRCGDGAELLQGAVLPGGHGEVHQPGSGGGGWEFVSVCGE